MSLSLVLCLDFLCAVGTRLSLHIHAGHPLYRRLKIHHFLSLSIDGRESFIPVIYCGMVSPSPQGLGLDVSYLAEIPIGDF